jgi:hypothetical protein
LLLKVFIPVTANSRRGGGNSTDLAAGQSAITPGSPWAGLQDCVDLGYLQNPFASCGLVFFFQLDDYNLDWFVAGNHVGVHGVGRVCGEPLGFVGFPDVRFGGAVLFDDFHCPARHRYDYARMLAAVHGEGEDDGLPHFHVVIFE